MSSRFTLGKERVRCYSPKKRISSKVEKLKYLMHYERRVGGRVNYNTLGLLCWVKYP